MLTRLGVVGERRGAKLIYLAVTSRLLERPVSVAVKGPSSGGKSFVTESVLKLFPASAFHALTAMSDRALAYSNEPLKHRHLVIFEAAGMSGEFATYLIRSLLSEGRLRYETVEKTKDGLAPRLIEREGPTGLIVTTTALRLHPENETRMLSLTVSDTTEQTAFVFQALANEASGEIDLILARAANLARDRIVSSQCSVRQRFGGASASHCRPPAARFQNGADVDPCPCASAPSSTAEGRSGAHRCDRRGLCCRPRTRGRSRRGRGRGKCPARGPRDRRRGGPLDRRREREVRQADLRARLKLDKSVISRRVADALDRGYLRNLEDRKGRPARLVMGDPLPDEVDVLPQPERLHGCTVVQAETGPSPPCCTECGLPHHSHDPLLDVVEGEGSVHLHRSCVAPSRVWVHDHQPRQPRSNPTLGGQAWGSVRWPSCWSLVVRL